MTDDSPDTLPASTPHLDQHCPAERFNTLTDAQAALVERRARAALSGSPHTVERRAYRCEHCEGAHLTRVASAEGAAA